MPLSQVEIELNNLFSSYANANTEEKKILNQTIRTKLDNRDKGMQLNLYGSTTDNKNSKIEIHDLDLSSLDLSGIHFSNMELYNVKFDGCDLRATSFSGKDIKNRMIIRDASFKNAACIQTVFSNTDLRNSTFIDTQFEDPSFDGSWLSANILKILIPSANYKKSSNNRPKINLKNTSYEDEDLRGLNLSELYLHDCYFKGANLQGVSFFEADIKGAVFKGIKNIESGQFHCCINKGNAYFLPRAEHFRIPLVSTSTSTLFSCCFIFSK